MDNDLESNVGKNDILKLLNVNNINSSTDKRKRGRPKKNSQLTTDSKIKNIFSNESDEEEIILHLKLTKEEIKEVINDTKKIKNNINISKDNDNYNYDDDDDDNNDSVSYNYNKDNYKDNKDNNNKDNKDNNNKDKDKHKKNIKEKKNKKHVDNSDIDSDEYDNVLKINDEQNEELENGKVIMDECLYHKMIKSMKLLKILNRELNNKNKYIEKITPMYSSVIETTPINFEIYNNETNDKILLKKQNISCWHCTESFTTYPIYLPEIYSDGKFYVRPGFFHSFNCAAGYNNALKDSMVKNRDSLLKKMFSIVHKDKINDPLDIKITPAPDPRYRLKKFGIGDQDSNEYNLKSKMIDCQHFDNVPLLVPMAGNLEIVFNNESNKNIEQSYKNKIESAK
jgi:hypothetical protein